MKNNVRQDCDLDGSFVELDRGKEPMAPDEVRTTNQKRLLSENGKGSEETALENVNQG